MLGRVAGAMKLVTLADDSQRFFLFEDFQHHFEFKLGGEFALTFAVHGVEIRLEIQLNEWS